MAAQRVQNYLEIHKIGPLFEDLMATLIRDMPNEPIQYLIRTLQKADQKLRSPRGISSHDRSKSASTPGLHKHGIGITGHAAPKRSTDAPHMALPGGRTSKETWGATNLSRSHERPASSDPKKREYQKPWLSGTKPGARGSLEVKKPSRPETGKKKQTWNPDTKTYSKDFDELLQSQDNGQPLGPQNKEKRAKYHGAKTWASGDENMPPEDIIIQGSKSMQSPTDGSEEIDVTDMKKRESTGDVDSTKSSPVKSKKLKASSKAAEKKLKLKALLQEDKPQSSSIAIEDDEESGDDSLEILEQADDLEGEGVLNAASSGVKLSKNYKSRGGDESKLQIKICARCAKVITTGPGQIGGGFSDTDSEYQMNARQAFSDITASDEDFESVSQVGLRGGRQQRWPVLDDQNGNRSERQMYRATAGGDSPPITDRDFFKDNAPARINQTSQKPGRIFSDTESEGPPFPVVGARDGALKGGRAWAVKQAETGSEADSDLLP